MRELRIGLAGALVSALVFVACQKNPEGTNAASSAAPSAEIPRNIGDKSGAAPQEQDTAGAPTPNSPKADDTTGSLAPGSVKAGDTTIQKGSVTTGTTTVDKNGVSTGSGSAVATKTASDGTKTVSLGNGAVTKTTTKDGKKSISVGGIQIAK